MDTMIVQMTLNMSGSRYDDRPWPPAWTDFEVPPWEGDGLIRAGMAKFIRMAAKEAPLRGPDAETATVSVPAETAAGPLGPQTLRPDWGTGAAVPAPPDAPPPAAPKQAWIDHAVSQGADENTVGMLTKQQLMEQYGGRP